MLPSKSKVRSAGKRLAERGDIASADQADIELIDEWRKAHLKPLTSIAMWLRKPAQEATGLSPAQRLKRRNTVLEKLISGRSRDASTMHDLGGCRLIFNSLETLGRFRVYLEKESRARHRRVHESDKYDYISNPKATGYRGVHYVYSYQPSSKENDHLRNLKVEIQLRTDTQHAWATAVEIADLVLGARTKFEDGTGQYGEFFRLSSEILARCHECSVSCLPDLPNAELKDRFLQEEQELQVLDRLDKLKEQGDLSAIRQHTVLAFKEDDTLEIFGFTKAIRAVAKEEELISDPACSHVVYVRASTPAAIRNSYRNYLTNPADFVKLMKEGLGML